MRCPSKRDWPKVVALLPVEENPRAGAEILEGIMSFVRSRPDWSIDIMSRERLIGCRDRLAGVVGRALDAELISSIRRRRLPMAHLIAAPSAAANDALVLIRDEKVGELGAQHLLNCGLERIVYLGLDQAFSHARAKGFVKAARSKSPERSEKHLHVVLPWTYLRPLYQRTIGRFLRTLKLPVGIMAWNDGAARLVIDECLKQGLRVPEDIAVIGVDNELIACELRKPQLSSVDVNRQQLGYEAMAALDRLVTGTAAKPLVVSVDPRMVIQRESTNLLHVSDELVTRALRWIRDRATANISSCDVVAAMGVSQSLLGARFRAIRGQSIGDEIRAARLDRAKVLLADPNIPLLEVATRCGFADLPHFCNIFRHGTGTTPGKFRLTATARANL